MKEIWIDCETGGTDCKKNPLIQICGDVIINDKVEESFNITMNAGGKVLESEALSVINLTPEQIAGYQDPASAYREFIQIIDRYINRYDKKDKFEWYGYNPRFDMDFCREWFSGNMNKYFGSYFWTPAVDVWMLAVYAQRSHRQNFENTKLWTMAKWYGVDVEKYNAHNAKDDIAVTRELYHKVIEVLCSKKSKEQF